MRIPVRLLALAVLIGLGVLLGWQMSKTRPAPDGGQSAAADVPKTDPPAPKAASPKTVLRTAPAMPPIPTPSPTVTIPIPPSEISQVPSIPQLPTPPIAPDVRPLIPPTVTPVAFAPPEAPAVAPIPPIPSPNPPALPTPLKADPPPPDFELPRLKAPMPDLSPLPLPGTPAGPTTPPVPALPKLAPLPAAPDGVAAGFVNTRRVAIEYEVTKKGASGLGTVELWLKDANGWQRTNTVKAGEPLEAELPVDGAYGVKVVPVSGQGVRGAEPAKDAEPDVWVVRDMVRPAVTLKVTQVRAKDGKPPAAPFMVEVVVREPNLDCQKLSFTWRDARAEAAKAEPVLLFKGEELDGTKIETKIGVFKRRQSGADEPGVFAVAFDFTPAPDVAARLTLRVEAIDRAGNWDAATAEFVTDLTEPAAKVTGIRPVPMK